jgi:hypothetical protein
MTDDISSDGRRRLLTEVAERVLACSGASDSRFGCRGGPRRPGRFWVLDGLFPHRDELIDCRDFSVFLEVPFAVSVARMAERTRG